VPASPLRQAVGCSLALFPIGDLADVECIAGLPLSTLLLSTAGLAKLRSQVMPASHDAGTAWTPSGEPRAVAGANRGREKAGPRGFFFRELPLAGGFKVVRIRIDIL
jgi:hypothetical protein